MSGAAAGMEPQPRGDDSSSSDSSSNDDSDDDSGRAGLQEAETGGQKGPASDTGAQKPAASMSKKKQRQRGRRGRVEEL